MIYSSEHGENRRTITVYGFGGELFEEHALRIPGRIV